MKILHADDDAVCRDVIRLILESEGRHSLTTAVDGEDAWKLLTDPTRSFDLAIIDVMMPRLDGLGLLERIRTTPGIGALPVIFCTALNDRNTVGRAAQLGVSQYVVKPYKKALVLERVRAVEADVIKHLPCEDAAVVAERLGVSVEVLGGLAKNLVGEIKAWLAAGGRANESAEYQRLGIAANGFNGACLSLGLPALAEEMHVIEALLLGQAGSQQRSISLSAPPEVATGLQRVQAQLDRVIDARKLAG